MTLWLGTIPSWLSFLLIVTVCNAVALILMWIARRFYASEGVATGPPVVNSWATAVGALMAVLCAFTIVTLWNTQARTYVNVDDEAAALRLLTRDLAPSQMPMLRDYVQNTVREWPRLCGGAPDPATEAALIKLERDAKPAKPRYANDLFVQLASLEGLRNRRWQATIQGVPDEIWVGLIVLGLALLVVLAVALPDKLVTHAALMVAIATAVGTLFWVGVLLEYPFCGTGSLGPDQIITVLREHLM